MTDDGWQESSEGLATGVAMGPRATVGAGYKWAIVGLLWFCGFFNYADRQAVSSVSTILKEEFALTGTKVGMIGSSFMVVYALAAPFSGFVVDLASRRTLIVSGLAFWSIICAATATARSYGQLLFYRAAEGLGESFYFPASMSLLADYHGPGTRSRAMSLHQTSVYIGTAGGGALAGFLGQRFGWRFPFWLLGLTGLAFAGFLATQIREPVREESKGGNTKTPLDELGRDAPRASLVGNLVEIVNVPAAVVLLVVFAGSTCVGQALIYWLTAYVKTRFGMDLTKSSLAGNLPMQMGSLVGVVIGGLLADRAARRPGGRMRVQGLGLILGAPCIFAAGWTGSVPVLLVVLVGVGLCKGVYDSNIFASVFDVVRPGVRGTTAGLMNMVGWAGGGLGTSLLGWLSDHYGLSPAIASMAAVYLGTGLLALLAARLASTRDRSSPP
jgi:MFS family permease